MPLTTFYASKLLGPPLAAEWDGANEADIATWLSSYSGAYPWTVKSTTASLVEFERVTGSGSSTVVVPLGFWIAAPTSGMNPMVMDPAGRWKTSDPHGRPEDINDFLAP